MAAKNKKLIEYYPTEILNLNSPAFYDMVAKKREYFSIIIDQTEFDEIKFIQNNFFGSSTINLNDKFLINNIAKKSYCEYGKFDISLVIADMRQIFVFTLNPYLYYIETIDKSQIIIRRNNPNDFYMNLENIVVGEIIISNKR